MNDLSSPGARAPNETGGGDSIDEGKRLIRSGGDKGLSLAERLSERFHRLTWRTPIHDMRLKGRHPLKLIAVPDDPFLGDVRRGNALLGGILTFRGESRAVEALDLAKPDFSKAFADYLHGFSWLRDLSTVATRAQATPVAEALMRCWLDAHADTVSEPAWRADLWGRRILFWTAHAPLILSSTDLVYRSRVLNALARGARHIDRGAEKVAPGAPRIAALCGVVAAGLLIPGGEARRGATEAALTKALSASIFDDGGNVARAPAAQVDLLMLLTQLREVYAARRLEPPASVGNALQALVPALLGVCLGDRDVGSWQGGAPIGVELLDQIIQASGVRTRPLRQAREWGYQRLAAGSAIAILDAAPPPVARLVEGGCASTLAFEFSDGPNRIVVNCGGARAGVAQLPLALAEGLRTTAAHSTLIVGDSNSTAIHADGTLGRGVGEVELARQESDGSSRIEASHDGYARRFGFLHRRQLVLASDGRELRGEDLLLPATKRRKLVATGFAIRFHLGLGVQVSPTADGQAALLRLPGGGLWQYRCRGGGLAVEESVWIDADGRPHATMQLVVTGESPAGGASVSWALKRAG
ncbi:heparinase II/III family protein [Sphingomonas psychrolutea]|uniref:Heparinase n=1 Tax=Sphingomonas psychrolutea TaxID=1259676 RepID=A0ABQ1GHG8_9SPHN|nr:heparinase II/III family protein [Sphingomonas psychrolutea]GGA43557.1 heparinase [Sphingomonas psychrolutea]